MHAWCQCGTLGHKSRKTSPRPFMIVSKKLHTLHLNINYNKNMEPNWFNQLLYVEKNVFLRMFYMIPSWSEVGQHSAS